MEKEIPFEELFEKSYELNVPLHFYPVGDLINKLGNNSKDNILHKDEITYDKNRNLKLTNFFKKNTPKEETKDNNIEVEINKEEKEDFDKEFKIEKVKETPKKKNIHKKSNENTPSASGKRRKESRSPIKASVSKKKLSNPPKNIKFNNNILLNFVNINKK